MDIAMPSALNPVNSPTSANLSRAAVFKGAAPSIGRAEDLSLWRQILDTHGSQILGYASNEFLDLAIARRLETIEPRDLVNLLAKAGRIGYSETDIITDNETDEQTIQAVLETQGRARSRLDATGTLTPLTPPSERVGQGDDGPADLSRASPIDRRPKSWKARRRRRLPGISTSCGPQRHRASSHMRTSPHGIEVVVIPDSSDSEPNATVDDKN
jgi:hypothetical protein